MSHTSSLVPQPAILLIDDNANNLRIQKDILVSVNTEIITALSGEDATSIVKQYNLAVIFLNVYSSSINGYHTAEMIRSNEGTKHVPIVLIRAMNSDIPEHFIEHGYGKVDYIYQPVERSLMLSKAMLFLGLWQSRNKLKLAKKDFQDFAYAAAHDIKAPLRHIQFFSEAVLEDNIDKLSDESCQHLEYVSKGAERLKILIDNLQLYAEVDARPLAVNAVDLNRVMAYVADDLADSIEKSGAQLEVNELPLVKGDNNQLHQVLFNIISNALKYNKVGVAPIIKLSSQAVTNQVNKKRVIKNSMSSTENMVQIVIEDNGIGFDNSHHDKIFLPFQRLVTRDEYEGSGIGLSTVKKILARHGGAITAKSNANIGSTFIVTLPSAI
ncbi:hypothetical protein A9Q74_12945 [Colwellia sp. 39_35_sub15_T18]|nr:hypothetical protein A9Q74_12945 [Colwellia sp. 39_35_sub15_T18]